MPINLNFREVGYILLFVVLLGISARISFNLPMTEINITAQTFVLLLLASIFKPQAAVAGIVLYLIMGIFGVPVFSNGASGWEYFIGGSFGYFIGFLLATALVTYLLYNSVYSSSYLYILLLHLIATLIILMCGSLRLSQDIGIEKAFQVGFIPFIVGGLIKSGMSSFLAYLLLNRDKNIT